MKDKIVVSGITLENEHVDLTYEQVQRKLELPIPEYIDKEQIISHFEATQLQLN